MSIENNIVENMFNLGLIKHENDNCHSEFVSGNNDIIIELDREKRLFSSSSEYSYLCKFTFKNNLGIILKQFTLSPLNVSIMLDNIYNLLEFGINEIYMQFECCGLNYEDIAIKIELKCINNRYYETFNLYNYINEQLVPILSFDIIDNIVDFCYLLYYTFLIDIGDFKLQDPYDFI
jgi:hypothetical protein